MGLPLARNRVRGAANATRLGPAFLWTPARVMFASYLAAIVLGTAALMAPACSVGRPLGLIDALFTATSALCVTGLTVVDTAQSLTRLGQWVVLVLIQAGGLGILTFTTWILMAAGRGIGGLERGVAVSSFGSIEGLRWQTILRNVFFFTVAFEAAGAIVLAAAWRERFAASHDAWFHGVFHSISAFCNAGFSTLPNGLVGDRADWTVNATIMGLIVAGGLGFLVLSDLTRGACTWLHRRRHRLTLHSRVVLRMSGGLILGGALAILLLDWAHGLAGMPVPEKCLAALFQSVTARTAGFNTVRIPDLTASSLFLIMLLMFIGASPGSTGGGVKTTTVAIVLALGRSQAYGRPSVELMERRIPPADVARALATLALYSLTFLVGATLLLLAQGWGQPVHQAQQAFQPIVFECLSALGTVGLSMDYTTQLTPISRLIVTALMICGRLGPITVVLTFVGRVRSSDYQYPEESVMTG